MAFTPITVTGSWVPNPAVPRGTVSFRLYEPLTDQTTLQVASGVITVPLDSTGAVSVILAASNDPTSSPVGVPYQVVENIDNTERSYYVVIPYDAAGGTVDLAALEHVTPPGVSVPPSSFLFRNLGDVDWSTPPANGQVFVWSEALQRLVPGTLGSSIVILADSDTPVDGSASEVTIVSGSEAGTVVTLPDLRAFIAGQGAGGVTVYIGVSNGGTLGRYTVPAQPDPWVLVTDPVFFCLLTVPQS